MRKGLGGVITRGKPWGLSYKMRFKVSGSATVPGEGAQQGTWGACCFGHKLLLLIHTCLVLTESTLPGTTGEISD
jgi:hypothetical protein